MKKIISLLLVMLLVCLPLAVGAQGSVSMVYDTIKVLVPDGYTIVGSELLDASMKVAVSIESAFYDESVMTETYGYAGEEECVKSFITLLDGIQVEGGGKYAQEVNGFPLYAYYCKGEKYMPPLGERMANDEMFTLTYLIDAESQLIYQIFFYGEAAYDQNVLDFLGGVQPYEVGYSDRAQNGLYSWEGGEDFFLD